MKVTNYIIYAVDTKGISSALTSTTKEERLEKLIERSVERVSMYTDYEEGTKVIVVKEERELGTIGFKEVDEKQVWEKPVNEENKAEKIIDTFLANWKEKARSYFNELVKEYNELKYKSHEITKENLQKVMNSTGTKRMYTDERIAVILNELETYPKFKIKSYEEDIRHALFKEWSELVRKSHIKVCENMRYESIRGKDQDYLEEFLVKDVKSKKETFYKNVQNKAGNIVTAKDLGIDVNGEINGIVEGEKAKVKVTTFSAGGYNIQRHHYRMTINTVK